MSLSNEAIIAIVTLLLTLPPLLDYLWRCYNARRQALAAHRDALDTEMQLVPSHSPQPSASPRSSSSPLIAARTPLHRHPEYRLYEQMQVVCVTAYKQITSRYSEPLCQPEENVTQT